MDLTNITALKPNGPAAVGSAALVESERGTHITNAPWRDAQSFPRGHKAKVDECSEICDVHPILPLVLMRGSKERGENGAFLRRQRLTADLVFDGDPLEKELAPF